jgi:GNAT superfamily N-acetyltransferase
MATVYQLDPVNSPEGRDLFVRAGVTFDRPLWEAPFEGLMPGRLYLDHPIAPASALLARTYDFFLAGEASPDITAFLHDAPAESGLYEWFYGFVPLTESWRQALPASFPALFREDRRAFRLGEAGRRSSLEWEGRVPAGVRVVPVDAALARQADDEVPEVISIIWDGYAQFARTGWGYAALDNDGRVLSIAYTTGLTAREVNLGVGTAARAQRRGLGKLVCQACIARATRDGLEVTWDCDLVNVASGRLAESLGFIEEDPFVEFGFPAPDSGWPSRITPEPSGRAWSRTPTEHGAILWTPAEI